MILHGWGPKDTNNSRTNGVYGVWSSTWRHWNVLYIHSKSKSCLAKHLCFSSQTIELDKVNILLLCLWMTYISYFHSCGCSPLIGLRTYLKDYYCQMGPKNSHENKYQIKMKNINDRPCLKTNSHILPVFETRNWWGRLHSRKCKKIWWCFSNFASSAYLDMQWKLLMLNQNHFILIWCESTLQFTT